MKKLLLLLIIPILFSFFGCEPEDVSEGEGSIVGIWEDNYEGSLVCVETNGESFTVIWSDTSNYSLLSLNDCFETHLIVPFYGGIDLGHWQDGDFLVFPDGGWSTNASSFCNKNEKLILYQNGTWVYLKGEIYYMFANIETDFPSVGSVGEPVEQPYYVDGEGLWAINDNVLTLTDSNANTYVFQVELNGNNLILDRSLVGAPEYITTWEGQ